MIYIFDFDGTLVDSFDKAIQAFNHFADDFRFRKVLPDEIPSLKNKSSQELIKHLEIPLYKIPSVITKVRNHLKSEMYAMQPFQHIPEVLQTLHGRGVKLGILTTNSKSNVDEWLNQYQLPYFDFIHAGSSMFGKARHLDKIIRKFNFEKSKCIYVGDETRDIEAAEKAGIMSVAVTWGFNTENVLRACKPDFVARNPQDLLEFVNTLQVNR